MSKKDYYDVLGIERSASQQEIKKAYLKFAKKYHPDGNSGDPNAEKKFKELSEAYEVLKDEQKKSAYDRFGHGAFENGGQGAGGGAGFGGQGGFSNADVNDIFGDFFSDFMGGGGGHASRARSPQVRGSDLKYNLEISLEGAFKGIDKKINFSTEVKCSPCDGHGTKDKSSASTCAQCGGAGAVRMQQGFFAVEQTCSKCNGSGNIIMNPCSTCHGHGRHSKQKHLMINVPSGIESNTRIRITGEGEAGLRGGSAGDLYVFVSVKPHDIYQVEGAHLHFKLPLSFTKAALGGEVIVPLIDGSKVKLSIPAGTETGDRVRLKEKGMSKVRSSSRGDLYAHAYIHTPKKLNKKQKELLEALDKELGEADTNYKDEGFFSRMKSMWS
jgi:molecular chaperone DnaJ